MIAIWSVVDFSKVRESGRFDAEYWEPAFLENEKQLDTLNCVTLREASSNIRSGPFGSNLLCETYVPDGVAVIRPFNLKGMTIERDNIAYIPESVCDDSALSFYREGDIMIARVGDVRAGVVRNISSKMTISPNVIAVRLNEKGLSPYYVTVFLNTWAGLAQMLRGMKTVAQPTITTDLVRDIRVPLLNEYMQTKIEETVLAAFNKDDVSRNLYAQAEALLLSELGFGNLDLSPTLFYERPFSEAKQVARLDAEFFQPKYYALLSRLKQAATVHSGSSIRSLSEPLKYGTSDKLTYVEEGVPFLRIADLESRRFEEASVLRISNEEASWQKSARVTSGDVLISRSGTLGLAVAIPDNLANAIFGSYFIRVRPKCSIIHPEFLSLYINTLCGALQVERLNTGGIQTNLTIPAIESIFVVHGDIQWQMRFVEIVMESVAARDESRRLLDEAKRMVEEAVLGGAC